MIPEDSASPRNARSQGFDTVRLAAALMVMWGHAWPIYYGFGGYGFGLEHAGVAIFFGLSGYLVTQSWQRDPSLFRFLARRGLRLLPGLWVCVLLCGLVLAPLVGARMADALPWLRWMILVPGGFAVQGAFRGNPGAGYLNTSLWTIPLEAACYALLAVLGTLGALRLPTMIGVGLLAGWGCLSLGGPIVPLLLAFAAGSCVALLGIRLSAPWPDPPTDISYGMYLYAFPMQQLAVWLVPGAGALGCLALALVPTCGLAVLSWRWVERPALRLKPRRGGRRASADKNSSP